MKKRSEMTLVLKGVDHEILDQTEEDLKQTIEKSPLHQG